MFIYKLLRTLYLSNLDTKVKSQLFYLQFLMIVQSSFEILGIISLLPFLGIILSKDYFDLNLLPFIKFNEQTYIIIFLIILIFLNWFSYLIGKKIFIFSEKLSHYFSELQIKNYLEDSINSHSSNLINNISIETYRFTRMVLIPSLLLISKITNIFFISIYLLFYSFLPTLIIITYLIFIIIFVYFSNKNKIKSIGDEITFSNQKRIHTLTEIVNNIPSIRIFKLEKIFLNIFSDNNAKYANSMAKNQYLILSQRYLVEGLIVISSVIIIYFISNNFNLNNYLTNFAVYLYAFYRVAPHLQSSLNLFSQAKSHYKSGLNLINTIITNHEVTNKNDKLPNSFSSIKLINFSYSYGSNNIFERANLEIFKGDKILLVGESGSGKTTILNLIFGILIFKDIKKILVNEKEFFNESLIYFNKYIGYVPQETLLFNESLYFNITFKSKINIDDNFYKEILNVSCLNSDLFKDEKHLNLFAKEITEKGDNLSVGQKQRISLARALYKKPEILILDETFNSIDKPKRNKILRYLNKIEDLTLIIVSHHKLEELDFNKIININDKRIYIKKLI